MMEKLIKTIEDLKKSKIKNLVSSRIQEFKKIGEESDNKIFNELCFCILTANFNAEKTIKIQKTIGNGFLTFPESLLTEKLKKLGYRYPKTRTKYIVEARKYKDTLKTLFKSFKDDYEIREWLIKNVRGFGYKEASHFLRNIGYTNFAIIDFHIVNLLEKYGLIKKPKRLTKRKYLEIENLLRKIAERLNLSLAELDLYLWYMETGKILK